MAAGYPLSLREIALGSGVSYALATKWARDANWPEPVVTVNRAIGRCARYDWDDVYVFFLACSAARQRRDAA
jgi:hypothetical protein